MFEKKGLALSSALIMIGLVLALWWMHSTEERVVISHPLKTTDSSRPPGKMRLPSSYDEASAQNIETLKPKLLELDQILDSKNDNDPRLDTDFKILSDAEKKALQDKYASFAPEKLNEKGTLVFLIGRNITSKEDVAFINQILKEAPCRSLANCSVSSPKSTGEAAHLDSANAITLAYPQVVSIKSLEAFLSDPKINPSLRELSVNVLQEATHSKSAVVADLARSALRKATP